MHGSEYGADSNMVQIKGKKIKLCSLAVLELV